MQSNIKFRYYIRLKHDKMFQRNVKPIHVVLQSHIVCNMEHYRDRECETTRLNVHVKCLRIEIMTDFDIYCTIIGIRTISNTI